MSDTIGDGHVGIQPTTELPLQAPESDAGERDERRFGIPNFAASGSITTTDADLASVRDADASRRWMKLPDGKRSRLRSLLAQLNTAVVRLRPANDALAMRDIDGAVTELTAALDLGAEPRVALCPACGRLGMAGATVCGHCWTAQAPSA